MLATIIRKICGLTLFVLSINTILFSQITTTLSKGPQWTDAMVVKSLKPSESGNANNNYSAYSRLASTAWTHSGYQITYRSLLKFDLSWIPPGTTVQNATLYLYADPAQTSGEHSNQSLTASNSLYLQKITQNWSNTTVTWNNQPATTTSGRVWVPASTSATGNIQVSITSLVQGMVNSPSTNYGIQMALANEVYYASRNYASSDHPNTALHPRLVITYAGTPDPVKDRMDYIFGGLNQADINTGILTDYGLDLADHTLFNGTITNQNETDFTSWTTLYASLLSSVINPSSNMVHLNTFNQQLENYLAGYDRDNPVVDLPTLFIAYQSLRSDALSLNLLTNNSDRLVDVAGRSQSPYTTSYAFASAPLLSTDDDGDVTFVFRQSLFVNSSQKTFSNFQVDFGDGTGYQTLITDVPKNIVYSSHGEKTLKFKIQFTDGTTYYSHSKFYVLSSTLGNPQARYSVSDSKAFKFPRANTFLNDCPELQFPNPQGVDGSFYGATVTVAYGSIGNRPTLDCNPQFIKPLIVLEGLDVGKFLGTNRNFNNFINQDIKGGLNIDSDPNMIGEQYFDDRLDAAGYDLIFVDYNEGAGDIVRNAYLLENIIQWVNGRKINNPVTGQREKNVVLGQSMGGLIARFAICDMEKRWAASPSIYAHHEVRMYVSHDSGHRGSNIPLGLQAAVNDLATKKLGRIGLITYGPIGGVVGSFLELKDVVRVLKNAYELLNDEPAPKQMLLVQDGTTNTFLEGTYRPMITFSPGYVPSFTMRALSNGSECGAGQLIAPGGELIYFDSKLYVGRLLFVTALPLIEGYRMLKIEDDIALLTHGFLGAMIPFSGKRWKTNFVVNATPASGTNKAYTGKITYEKKILFVININIDVFNSSRNSIAGTLPWESAPGGYYDLQEAKAKVGNVPEIEAYPILENNLLIRMSNTFGHVPTASALDITQTITTAALTSPYTGGNNPTYPSRFPTFKTQERLEDEPAGSFNNTRHIQFTTRNANWIFNEMEGISQPPSSCMYLCSNLEAISGPSIMCENTSFLLSNPPANATITWQATPTHIFSTSSGNGSTANLILASGSSNGTAALTFTITGAECGPKVLSKSIDVGKASINYISFANSINLNDQFCTNAYGNTFTLETSTSNPSSTEARLLNFPSLTVAYTLPYSYSGSSGPYDWNYVPIPNNGWYVFEARVSNGCGTTDWFATEVEYIDCGDGEFEEQFFVVFPNPSTSEIFLDEKTNGVNEYSLGTIKNSQEEIPIQLELIDDNGKQVFRQELTNKSIPYKIDTHPYKNGIYYLKVFYEGKIETTRIEVRK